MKYAHLYTGKDGKSHFEDIEVEYQPTGPGRQGSVPMKATSVTFVERSGVSEPHNAPRRQLIVYLGGEVEIVASDGAKRLFRPGDVMLAEDKTGPGHINRGPADKPRQTLIITLE